MNQNKILKKISKIIPFTISELNTKTQTNNIVIIRYICYYFLRKYTKLSLSSIGFHIGRKDHATVIYGIKQVEIILNSSLKIDKDLKIKIQTIESNMLQERECPPLFYKGGKWKIKKETLYG